MKASKTDSNREEDKKPRKHEKKREGGKKKNPNQFNQSQARKSKLVHLEGPQGRLQRPQLPGPVDRVAGDGWRGGAHQPRLAGEESGTREREQGQASQQSHPAVPWEPAAFNS